MIYSVLITVGLIAFSSRPPLAIGDTFTVAGVAAVLSGPYKVTSIILLPDGNYPPSDGSAGCHSPTGEHARFSPGDPLWAVCVEPSPPYQTYADVEIVVEDAPLFSDGFESGDASRWSVSVPPPAFFADGFESGDVSKWSYTSRKVSE